MMFFRLIFQDIDAIANAIYSFLLNNTLTIAVKQFRCITDVMIRCSHVVIQPLQQRYLAIVD